VFHELSGGQLDCYVEYSGFIFLVGYDRKSRCFNATVPLHA